MKISVVMPSYLHEYQTGPHKSATNREFKFKRAVDSFLTQSHADAELVIVSDGCELTNKIVEEEYSSQLYGGTIVLEKMEKQPLFSGRLRARGVELSSGDMVCYLDTDDIFGTDHLKILDDYYDLGQDWCYYDDYLFDGVKRLARTVKPEHCKIGTSSFCHMRATRVQWKDGYGHDWLTISELLSLKHCKINTPEYLVCHLSALNLDY